MDKYLKQKQLQQLMQLIGKINWIKYLLLFDIGGLLYFLLENFYRGYSHLSMFALGGTCFILIGSINTNYYTWDMALISQMFLSTVIVTCLEFISGIILNLFLDLNIWTYSDIPYNILGQICLFYSFIWFWLSLPAILLDDYIRYILFEERNHKYKLF